MSSNPKGIRSKNGKWAVQITRDGQFNHIGTFGTLPEAQAAYADAVKKNPRRQRGYCAGVVDAGPPGEPRSLNVMVPYDLWIGLDKIARKENKSRNKIVQPFVISAISNLVAAAFPKSNGRAEHDRA